MPRAILNGNDEWVVPYRWSLGQRADYIKSFLRDDRARFEFDEAVSCIDRIIETADDENLSSDAENILMCLEAIVGYESGNFKGSNYWQEVYWDNYSKWYGGMGQGK